MLCIHDIPVNTKHLYNICATSAQRQRRWADVVQMLYKCFVFTGISQQTRDAQSMLLQRRANVEDDEPALHQHWLNVFARMGKRGGGPSRFLAPFQKIFLLSGYILCRKQKVISANTLHARCT